MKKIFCAFLFTLMTIMSHGQTHLPPFKYSKQPAVLCGSIVGNNTLKPEEVKVIYFMKYNSGIEDRRKGKKALLDDNGFFSLSIPSRTTAECLVMVGDHEFPCYIVPGDTVSFILDMAKLETNGIAQSLSFRGILSDFNHDLVYATEQGIDPHSIYLEIEGKRNMGALVDELREVSVDGYFQFLDSIYIQNNDRINEDCKIGDSYREFAKAVNHYHYGDFIPFCAYSIQNTGLDTEEEYRALKERQKKWLENYMQDDPWTAPSLSYIMWSIPELFVQNYVEREVELPEDYMPCHLASKYMMQIGQQSQLLSEAQIDSVRIYIPEIGDDVLDYNERLEQKLAFVNEHGMSRICSLEDEKIENGDILSALLEPYRGRPVLLDIWETTCGPCRLAFKDMHEMKLELSDRIHFVNIASEHSDLSTWKHLVPSYIGNHYRLTEQQLKVLHDQLPCDTSGVPLWVLVNADGSIHHTFRGWGGVELMMQELQPVLQ